MRGRREILAGLTGSLVTGGLLAGCAPRPSLPLQAPAPDVLPQSFGDARPHPWEGGAPQQLAVHGIDVARWQSRIDWPLARRQGVNFAFIKATEGADGTHVNPEFSRQWQHSAAAGVRRGAYHLYYWCAGPEAQARHFIETVPRVAGDLPPVLDLEWNPTSPSCRLRPGPAEVRDLVARYAAVVERHYGQRPVLYMTVDFHADSRMGWMDREELWLRSVAAHPRLAYGRGDFRFWQYSGTGRINGIEGDVDLNAFNGSRADWGRWLAARSIR